MMLQRDKVLHFVIGLALFFIFVLVVDPAVSLFLVAIVGAGKEIYDWFHQDIHIPDILDAIATMGGGTTGLLLNYLYDRGAQWLL